jgi:hypothetical protein
MLGFHTYLPIRPYCGGMCFVGTMGWWLGTCEAWDPSHLTTKGGRGAVWTVYLHQPFPINSNIKCLLVLLGSLEIKSFTHIV